MVITVDSKEIRLVGDKYEYIGADNSGEKAVDLIYDGLVEIFLNKPLHVSGDVRVNALNCGNLEVDGCVDVKKDANVKKLWAPKEDVFVGNNLFAWSVDCFGLAVKGNAYVLEYIDCDSTIEIHGELRSKTNGALKVRTCNTLSVEGNVELDAVEAYAINVGGYLKTAGDVVFCDCLEVEDNICCGGKICYDDIDPDSAYEI